MILASYIRTTSAGANWYGAKLSEISRSSLTLQYFEEKQARNAAEGLSTVVFDEEEDQVRWCTQFEWADTLSIEGKVNPESGRIYLETNAILSLEERQKLVASKRTADAPKRRAVNPDGATL